MAKKGQKLSDTEKRKISLGFSVNSRTKISKRMQGNRNNLGNKRSEGTRTKQSRAMIGNKNTPTGERNHLWKGGITPLVFQIRHCFKYRQWRSDIFTRDNFMCVLGGKVHGNRLHADHIKSFSVIFAENNIQSLEDALNCEEFWNINNGRTLCVLCHKDTDNYGGRPKKKIP